MKYKLLANSIVAFCLIIGAALMTYADIKKRDLSTSEQIETQPVNNKKANTCSTYKLKNHNS